MAKNGTNGSSGTKTITLPESGKEIVVDRNKMRDEIKTRKDLKRIQKMDKGDEFDRWVCRYVDLSFEELEDLSIKDFDTVGRAVGEVMSELFSPNLR